MILKWISFPSFHLFPPFPFPLESSFSITRFWSHSLTGRFDDHLGGIFKNTCSTSEQKLHWKSLACGTNSYSHFWKLHSAVLKVLLIWRLTAFFADLPALTFHSEWRICPWIIWKNVIPGWTDALVTVLWEWEESVAQNGYTLVLGFLVGSTGKGGNLNIGDLWTQF